MNLSTEHSIRSAVAGLAVTAAVVAGAAGCSQVTGSQVESYKVKRGEFVNSITVTGQLDAVNSEVIMAPEMGWRTGIPKIAQIVEDGKKVEAGEVLVQFDQTEVLKTISDTKAELEIAQAELTKTQVSHRSDLSDLGADLEVAKISFSISKLKLEQAAFEAEIDRKKIELDLKQSEINLEQAGQNIENRKKIQKEEISKLELRVNQAKAKMQQAEQTLEDLTIRAPSPGIAIIRQSWMTRNKFQVDDQVHPGWPLIGLPDLSRMKAEVEINEVEISHIEVGQKAAVRLDAFPEAYFSGEVNEISTLARNKNRDSKVKVFDTIILIDGMDDRLMPGMTVSCEIYVGRIPDTLFIPVDALFYKEGRSVVYVMNGSGFEEREVRTGDESEDYVVIAGGLEEGERVALRDPTIAPEKEEKGKVEAEEAAQ
ncbi:MAG: efflux RND transporter periplasmic adaptor subunit [Candidatus Glassbacteria bacterium]